MKGYLGVSGYNPQMVVEEVIKAHGGADRWNSLKAIEAGVSAWGLLFTMKLRPVLNHVRVRASTHEPRLTFFNFPRPGQMSQLIADQEVCIQDSDGKVVARRVQPRSAFRGLRHQFYWDRLDFIYFGGYATWNYLVIPFLFLRDGFAFEALKPLPGMSASWSRLRVTFPGDIPTHCKRQVFYFDEHRHLRRFDYTAEVVGGWAHAAHLCEGYRDFDAFKAPTRRRVRPLFFGNRPLPAPTLVALEFHDIRPIPVS